MHSTWLPSRSSGSKGNEPGTVGIAPLIRPAAEALGLELVVDGLMPWDLGPPDGAEFRQVSDCRVSGTFSPTLSVRMNGPASEDAMPEATRILVCDTSILRLLCY